MTISTAETALLTKVASTLTGFSVAAENAPFVKPSNAKWAEVFFLPNLPSVETLGASGTDETDGILQIDIHYPRGTGRSAARTDAETVRSNFKAGQRLTSSGQVVEILACGPSQGRSSDNWYTVTITVSWRASLPR